MTDFTERLRAAISDRYVIERHLGEGGMATVYLAHDLKHDRKVALKVLRPELAAVIGADRFLTEIKTTANLQHPNILPLFDSGDADGRLFYVMPYVEGESLRDRIAREKQLPVEEAFRLGVEVASALDYAHRQGVVHRDIKPENILLHEGRALVADFGIALALSTAGGERMTETGMSVGTPHYMSPEQAMGGHEVTARSDVYALGATLYEALVGDPPFTGSTAQAIIARIVTEDPRPLVTQRKTIPAHVEAAVLKALERLPADRFATAAELGEALEGRLKVEPRTGATADGPGLADARKWRRAVVLMGVAIAVLTGTTVWGWLRARRPNPVSRETIALSGAGLPRHLWFGGAVAPDGSAIVYLDSAGGGTFGSLWIKERGELDAHRLVKLTSGGTYGPDFSPDGQWIVYTDGGKLRKVPRAGGAPVVLSDSLAGGGAAWLDDGTLVFGGGDRFRSELLRTTATGGPTTRVLTLDSTDAPQRVAPVPGAEAVLVDVLGPDTREIAVDLKTGSHHVVARGAVGAWVVRGGYIVYAQPDGALFAARFDVGRLALAGPAVPVLDHVRTTSLISTAVPDATLGANGTLVYVEGPAAANARRRRLTAVTRGGSVTPLDTMWSADLPTHLFSRMAISPDGSRVAVAADTTGRPVAVAAGTAGRRDDIYVLQIPNGPVTRLTFTGTRNLNPAWSPDGRRILYASDVGGKMELWSRNADGSGRPVRVVSAKQPITGGLWSPDGKWIVYTTDEGEQGTGARAFRGDIMAVRTAGDSTPVPLVATESMENLPALSPDGRWLAYTSWGRGEIQVFVRPFPHTQDGVWQVSTIEGMEPEWSPDGKELFYRRNRRGGAWELMATEVTGSPTFSVRARKSLFDVSQQGFYYAVRPDGRGFLWLTPEVYASGRRSEESRLVLVRNWLPELKAKLKQQGGA